VRRKVAIAGVLVVAIAGILRLSWRSEPVAREPERLALRAGWTELPLPPETRAGAVLTWAGSELIAWGGCDPRVEDSCKALSDGFVFDLSNKTWRRLPPAPMAGADWISAVTEKEVVFLSSDENGRMKGQAFDPASERWRTIVEAPIEPRWGAEAVWTGDEVLVWGGGTARKPSMQGAAYDPAEDSWRLLPDAPRALNAISSVWTGREMISFGSLLDYGNRAATKVSVGVAYDPEADSWRKLPRSRLSPQATSAQWIGDRLIAWDYQTRSQVYDPTRDSWTSPRKMPFERSECYPGSAVVHQIVFGFYCGQAAVLDDPGGEWKLIEGGPLKDQISAGTGTYKLWRFAHLVPARDTLLLSMQGITTSKKGVVCYGCPGSPLSFWAYRPPD
jgi:hypothetical protein